MPAQQQVNAAHELTQGLPAWASKAILEQIDEAIIITSMDGSYRRMNWQAAKLYGYKEPSEYERHLPKLSSVIELRSYPTRKRIPFRDWPSTRLQHGSRRIRLQAYLRRLDTKWEVLLTYDGKVVKGPDGAPAFVLLVVRDTSATKKLEEQDGQAAPHNQLAEDEAGAERERLELAQRAGKIGTFEWRIPEDRNIWSEQLEELYGMPHGSFGGRLKDWQKVVDPSDIKRVHRILERAFRNHERYFESEWRIILPGQKIRNIYAKAEIFYSRDGKPMRMVGINMDITERRRAAQAYKASIDRQSAFFRTALDAIVTIDHSGAITEFNPAAERLFGYSRNEAVGQPMGRLIIPPQHRQVYRLGLARYVKTSIGMVIDKQIETTALRKDGKEFPIELFVTRIGHEDPPVFMGTLRDITERKRAVQDLRDSEARFRFMAESMPQKIFTTAPSGATDYVNPQWMEYTGLSRRKLVDEGWNASVHPDDLKATRQAWQQSLDTGEPFQVEHRFRRADGTYHWHLSRANAMRDKTGRIIKWIGSNTDIEDIKRRQELEEEKTMLTAQREQLMALNRAKDEFISLASHQLRTPATGVKQYVGMLMQGYFGDLNEEQQAMVRSAYQSNERQLNIINALLNVARLDAGKVKLTPVPCDLSQMLEDTVQEQAEVFRMRHQKLTLRMPHEPVVCHADPQLIRMVVENIIDNAGKYSPEGRDVKVRLSQSVATTRIEVQDHGVGMRKADQAKLFQKFSRIDNELSTSASGSGLGLYWAKKIMDLHHGSIRVESRLRQGSVFTVTIPNRE